MSHRSQSVSHNVSPRSGAGAEVSVTVDKSAPVEAAPVPVNPTFMGVEIRFLVLPLLTAQNASAVLLMRAVRSLPGETEFSTLTAVIMQEVFKLAACVVILLFTEGLAPAWNKPIEALKTVCFLFVFFFSSSKH